MEGAVISSMYNIVVVSMISGMSICSHGHHDRDSHHVEFARILLAYELLLVVS